MESPRPATEGSHGNPAVLPARLEPPFRRPGIIERTRVAAHLASLATPIVALVAPAGYGKSTAALQFAERQGLVAWYLADSTDADPATLTRGLAAAVHRVAPLPEQVLAEVAAPGPSVWAGAVPWLRQALADRPDITLVIDDVDRIGEGEASDIVLALARKERGRPARIILAGRTLGAVPGPRLVAAGLLTVVGREVLALDQAETTAVLTAAGARDSVDPEAVLRVTEGWAAGVYLSALAGDPDDGRSPAVSPAAPTRAIEEYLRQEVLGAMDPADADLLVRSGALDRLSGPLCDAVLARTGSGADLDRLERTNLFLIPLDEDRTWFRCHSLLADFLRAEVGRQMPGEVRALRRRAAEWHAANGLLEEALEYAMSAEDEDHAAMLLTRLGQPTMNAGRTATLCRWFDWFDERAAGPRQPGLVAFGMMTFAVEGDATRAERWAALADTLPGRDDPSDAGAALRSIARVLLLPSGVADGLAAAEHAVRVIHDEDVWRVAALAARGLTRLLGGQVAAGEEDLVAALDRWERYPIARVAAVIALIHLASLALARRDRTAAEASVTKARAILREGGMTEIPLAAAVDAIDARCLLARGAIVQAKTALAHAQRLRTRLGHTVPAIAVRARLDLIEAHLAMGDPAGARTLLHEIREIQALRPDLGSLDAEVRAATDRTADMRGGIAGATTLTLAELRLLPLLTSHLSFREIGDRLFVSHNTVKTQAISIYRKLDATSRSEAIDRAVELGLLGGPMPTVPSSTDADR
jgi:LuxR family transcriptional regulator, maltose regulon positive regulatory protein